jgi:methylenetetrahydrofolate reductase (NADPH)
MADQYRRADELGSPRVTQISIELVPRSAASLDAELALVRSRFPAVDTINVPDLLRFPLRSWDACAQARRVVGRAIPHLRAMDFAPDRPFPLREKLALAGIDTVLVVTGDPPQDLAHRVHPTTPVELIRRIKREAPELRVFAALDPYRAGLQDELGYARAKLDAGADGLFSQPLFDARLLDVWAEQLRGVEVWWGVTPVVGAKTRAYWERKNRAFFPGSFAPTLEWSRRFAEVALAWAAGRDANLYFMPIRVDLADWLDGVLGAEE